MLWIRRVIALSQLAGGVLLIAVELGARGRGAALPALHIALALLLGSASALTGLLLWRGSSRGRLGSLAVQALQLVQFNLAAASYAFVAGVQFIVFGTSALLVGINYGFLGVFSLGQNKAVLMGLAPSYVAVNLVALASIVFLLVDSPAAKAEAPASPLPG